MNQNKRTRRDYEINQWYGCRGHIFWGVVSLALGVLSYLFSNYVYEQENRELGPTSTFFIFLACFFGLMSLVRFGGSAYILAPIGWRRARQSGVVRKTKFHFRVWSANRKIRKCRI